MVLTPTSYDISESYIRSWHPVLRYVLRRPADKTQYKRIPGDMDFLRYIRQDLFLLPKHPMMWMWW